MRGKLYIKYILAKVNNFHLQQSVLHVIETNAE